MSIHDDGVRKWRMEQFTDMGFTKSLALLLSKSRVDLHQARKMIEQGCPHETLTAIFLEGDEAQQSSLIYEAEPEEAA